MIVPINVEEQKEVKLAHHKSKVTDPTTGEEFIIYHNMDGSTAIQIQGKIFEISVVDLVKAFYRKLNPITTKI